MIQDEDIWLDIIEEIGHNMLIVCFSFSIFFMD